MTSEYLSPGGFQRGVEYRDGMRRCGGWLENDSVVRGDAT